MIVGFFKKKYNSFFLLEVKYMMLSVSIIEILIRRVAMETQMQVIKKMSSTTFQMYGCILRIALTGNHGQKNNH